MFLKIEAINVSIFLEALNISATINVSIFPAATNVSKLEIINVSKFFSSD